jgi:hypothetical protein
MTVPFRSAGSLALMGAILSTSSSAQSTSHLTYSGSVRTVPSSPLGPFGNAAVGDAVTIEFDAQLPGTAGAANTRDYTVDPTSIVVSVGAATDTGAPGTTPVFSLKFDPASETAFGLIPVLSSGLNVTVLAFDFLPIGSFTSNDLSQQNGTYPTSDFDLISIAVGPSSSSNGIEVDFESLVIESDGGLGTAYCDTALNSTGAAGQLAASGTPVVSSNNLTLTASVLPPLAFGFFIVSDAQGFVQNPGGSAGNLCLSGSIGRFVGPGEIQQSSLGGAFSLPLNLASLPSPNGFFAVAAGDTLNFQTWFRDSTPAGTPTSNFTSGLSVLFQ